MAGEPLVCQKLLRIGVRGKPENQHEYEEKGGGIFSVNACPLCLFAL